MKTDEEMPDEAVGDVDMSVGSSSESKGEPFVSYEKAIHGCHEPEAPETDNCCTSKAKPIANVLVEFNLLLSQPPTTNPQTALRFLLRNTLSPLADGEPGKWRNSWRNRRLRPSTRKHIGKARGVLLWYIVARSGRSLVHRPTSRWEKRKRPFTTLAGNSTR